VSVCRRQALSSSTTTLEAAREDRDERDRNESDEHRDMTAATAFFGAAKMVTGVTPDRVTTDGHDSYPRAIRTTLGASVGSVGTRAKPIIASRVQTHAHANSSSRT
jgi:hypothetical protein